MRNEFELYMAQYLGYPLSEIRLARDKTHPLGGYLYAFDVTHPLNTLDRSWVLWKVAYEIGVKNG